MQLGRYETIRVLGTGGMATVYLARAEGIGGFERLVALKVLHPHIAKDETFEKMFVDEARLAARIRHPNVVGTLDIQRDHGQLFQVMDYIEGPSLSALLTEQIRIGEGLALGLAMRLLCDVLAGLHAAHELKDSKGTALNIVHRDVSPPNILIGINGVARLSDFGVAHAEQRLTQTLTGQIKGKLSYMAPEQAFGDPLDRRCDIYAMGIVTWELFANKRLFTAEKNTDKLIEVAAPRIDKPTLFRAKLPAALENVCLRALEIERDDRFSTAKDMRQALMAAAEASNIALAKHSELATHVRRYLDEHLVTQVVRLPHGSEQRAAALHEDTLVPSGDLPMEAAQEGRTETAEEGQQDTDSGMHGPSLPPFPVPTSNTEPGKVSRPIAAPVAILLLVLFAVLGAGMQLWWTRRSSTQVAPAPSQPPATANAPSPTAPVGAAPTKTASSSQTKDSKSDSDSNRPAPETQKEAARKSATGQAKRPSRVKRRGRYQRPVPSPKKRQGRYNPKDL